MFAVRCWTFGFLSHPHTLIPSHSATPAPPRRPWLGVALRLLIAGLVVWFLAATVRSAWGDLSDYRLRPRLGWLIAAGCLYLAGLLPCAWVWRRALTALGATPKGWPLLRAYFVGHLGKYVPGKAMVVVLRAGLLRDAGANARAAAIAVLYETLTMMAIGAALAAGIIAVMVRSEPALALLAAGLAVVSFLPTLPPVFRFLATRLRLNGAGEKAPNRLASFELHWAIVNWLAIAVGWVLIGASLWAVLQSMPWEGGGESATDAVHTLALCTAAAALATVAGFLSLLPGGILVREAVLVLLLGEAGLNRADALIAAVLLRVVWLAAELLISALLYFAARPRR